MADVCHLCICSVVFACHSTSRSRNVRSKNVQLDQERESQEKSGQEKDCQEMSIKKSRSRNGRSKNVHDPMLTYVRRNSEQVLATEFHETFLHPTFDNQGLKYYCVIVFQCELHCSCTILKTLEPSDLVPFNKKPF